MDMPSVGKVRTVSRSKGIVSLGGYCFAEVKLRNAKQRQSLENRCDGAVKQCSRWKSKVTRRIGAEMCAEYIAWEK